MKILPGLLSLLLVACARSASANTDPATDIRCELLALDVSADSATASFRASNDSGSSIAYRGYTEGGPLHQCEVLEGGVWQASPLGWCGTGVEEQLLRPGETLDFSVNVPMDGRSYRFSFGEPPILTSPVSAAPK